MSANGGGLCPGAALIYASHSLDFTHEMDGMWTLYAVYSYFSDLFRSSVEFLLL
ncbi:hypothetical protein D3C80_1471400 [compost metagenome]